MPIQVDATLYTRPIKVGGNQNYVDEVASGYPELPAKELDDDLNVLYNGINVLLQNLQASAIAVVGTNPPGAPIPGQMWWRTTDGNLYIWYDDGSSQQWVSATKGIL